MIRDEDGQLTGYVYVDLATFGLRRICAARASTSSTAELHMPAGYSLKWSGEFEFQLRARKRLTLLSCRSYSPRSLSCFTCCSIPPPKPLMLLFPAIYALTGGLMLQYLMGFNFSVAVWVGYIALFGIAVETGVVMVIYLDEALDRQASSRPFAACGHRGRGIEGAVPAARPKLMTVAVVMLSLAPILWVGNRLRRDETDRRADRRRMITSTIHVLNSSSRCFFAMMKDRVLRAGD